MNPALPIVHCHEFAGTVVAAGPDVAGTERAGSIKVGACVGVPGRAYRPCGRCWECRHNEERTRPATERTALGRGTSGSARDGGFREYAVADARAGSGDAGGGMTFVETAPLMCAGADGVRGAEVVQA